MTVEEAREEKVLLEKSIRALIRDFELLTKFHVTNINLESYRVVADDEYVSRTHQVEVECHL